MGWQQRQETVIADIKREREKQDDKWGIQEHTAPVWVSIIGEEYGETCKAVNEFMFHATQANEQEIYNEAIQTAASCVALCEHILRVRRGRQ